jgi:tryptophanyl-tRNA synthetase
MNDTVFGTKKHRLVSGIRATGRLHLGNYHGALKNWVNEQSKYDCFFFIADWHALTTDYENPGEIALNTYEMMIDWLAAGLNPEQCCLFVQSDVPEHAELHLLFSMITPLGWLERVPSYKDQKAKLKEKHLNTYGFLGYPTLQSADILAYKADFVPVGADQVSHIELTRELVRHFNHLYINRVPEPIFSEPQALLSVASKLPGLDGQKMSKSYNNTIGLREDPKEVTQKIRTMPTDPARVRRTDPGEPEKCPVWSLHQVYSSEETKAWVQVGCRTAGIGCIECKQPLIQAVLAEQAPIREKAEYYAAQPALIESIIKEGGARARAEAHKTLIEVRHAMGLSKGLIEST